MRIQPVDPDQVEPPVSGVLSQQAQRWGAPLLPYLAWENASSKFNHALGVPSQHLWRR